jgi:ferredoxin
MKAQPNAPPQIVEGKCVGCGACVAACPKKLIELVPRDRHIFVRCSSHDKGKDVKAVCTIGCVTCTLCAKKKCKNGAITIVDNIPVIDYAKCQECGECANGCPSKNIINLFAPSTAEPPKPTEVAAAPPQATNAQV